MTSTLVRLAFAGLRTRLLATALTVLLAAAAPCTLVLVLEVRETGRDPWQRTFAAAHGAHVLANVPTSAVAESLRALDGVTEAGDPVPVTTVELTTSRSTEPLRIGGLSGTPTVNAPIVTSGTAEPGDGVVLERSLARALGLDGRGPTAPARPGRRGGDRGGRHCDPAEPVAVPPGQSGVRLGGAVDHGAAAARPGHVALGRGAAAA